MSAELASQALVDTHWMGIALEEAKKAAADGEVPVGAIVVKDGAVVSRGRNQTVQCNDPTAHAEIVALRSAAQTLGNFRLSGCTLYVTLEPCAMCAGAALHARVDRVVFGASESKTGAAHSILNLFGFSQLNHQTAVQGAVMAEDCASVLSDFFKDRRQEIKSKSKPLREDALRTPIVRFEALPVEEIKSHYISDTPTLAGLQMHYWDEGPRDASQVVLGVHGNGSWGVDFLREVASWVAMGKRVIVPDLIGFGRSDKFKRLDAHTFQFHSDSLLELLDFLEVKSVELAVPSQETGNLSPRRTIGCAVSRQGPQCCIDRIRSKGARYAGYRTLRRRASCIQVNNLCKNTYISILLPAPFVTRRPSSAA